MLFTAFTEPRPAAESIFTQEFAWKDYAAALKAQGINGIRLSKTGKAFILYKDEQPMGTLGIADALKGTIGVADLSTLRVGVCSDGVPRVYMPGTRGAISAL